MAIITWNKKYRETLGESVNRFRSQYQKYMSSKITYAGRLDPLAEGLLLLLTDNDVHKKPEFLLVDKTYQVEFMLGYQTDSYDILGLITSIQNSTNIDQEELHQKIIDTQKTTSQIYPPYSSKTVQGKPMWRWSRDGHISDITAPEQNISVKRSRYISSRVISINDFKKEYIYPLTHVQGDFRQSDIISKWEDVFDKQNHKKNIILYTAEFSVSSGTYIRSLIHNIGIELGVGGVCVKISRSQVGNFHL